MIQTKSVRSDVESSDGLRILVTRFRGRGLSGDRYDVWMPNLGPSETLLAAALAEETSWPEFKRRYKAELFASERIDAENRTIKNHGQKFTLRLLQELARRETVTLLCHCAEDVADNRCHRFILKEILEKKVVG